MEKKESISKNFISYLKKSTVVKTEQIKKNVNFENTISGSIQESFKHSSTQSLADFGYLVKKHDFEKGKRVLNVEFVPNPGVSSRLSNKYIMTQKENEKKAKRNKIIKISAIILGILLLVFLVSYITISVTKKDNLVLMSDDGIMIEKDTERDPNLKQGEFKREEVIINGRAYIKYTYIIKKGDMLWVIAKRFLNDPYGWPKIHENNEYIDNPHLIYINDQLLIYIPKK